MKLSRASVGLALRAARGAASQTLTDLGNTTKISTASLSRSENGLRDLTFSELVEISAALNIDVSRFLELAETFERSNVGQNMTDIQRELNDLQREAIEAAIETLSAA